MIFKSSTGLLISLAVQSSGNTKRTALFCIHGFAGSKKEWKFPFPTAMQGFDIISIDLPGFGESDSPENPDCYTADFTSELLAEIIESFKYKNNILLGYSMGGRYALSFACRFPRKLVGLIIESGSPGIEDRKERNKRVLADELVCSLIQAGGIETFTDYWLTRSIFKTQQNLPYETIEWIRNEKLNSSPAGLINSLTVFGTGAMPHLWNDITNVEIPVMLIAGSEDEKYRAIQNIMIDIFPSAKCHIIEAAGHNTHIEKPEQFAKLIVGFINDLGLVQK